MCYCPTPTLHLNLALTGDGAFLFSLKKTHSVWFISVLNYGDTENVLINHLLLVIPMSYPCHYTNLCPHKPHHTPHTHTPHTHTHTHTHTTPHTTHNTHTHTSIPSSQWAQCVVKGIEWPTVYQGDSSGCNQCKQDERPYQKGQMQTWTVSPNKKGWSRWQRLRSRLNAASSEKKQSQLLLWNSNSSWINSHSWYLKASSTGIRLRAASKQNALSLRALYTNENDTIFTVTLVKFSANYCVPKNPLYMSIVV